MFNLDGVNVRWWQLSCDIVSFARENCIVTKSVGGGGCGMVTVAL
jgi:hypothetical protein